MQALYTIRAALFIFAIISLGVLVASIFWMGLIETTYVYVGNVRIQLPFIALWSFGFFFFSSLLFWFSLKPNDWQRSWRTRQTRKGHESLEAALLAAAGGDAHTARREALKATKLLDSKGAPRLLAAQTAEAEGDLVEAEAHYAAMLTEPSTALVGRRGLAAAAITRGDLNAAIVHAGHAFARTPSARWAFELLFDAQIKSSAWAESLATLNEGRQRKHVDEIAASRRRSVILTAQAANERNRNPELARNLAEQAVAASDEFAPGAALCARLTARAGRSGKAAHVIENAWRTTPHPALVAVYRDLDFNGHGQKNAKLRELANLNPDHRESLILLSELALEANNPAEARQHLEALLTREIAPTARVCLLMSAVAQAEGDEDAAHEWSRRATHAPSEPEWADLDPVSGDFAYGQTDWPRLVYSFGDRGVLVHTRHERYERQYPLIAGRPSGPPALPKA